MNFEYSDKTRQILARVRAFMERHVYPSQDRYHAEIAEGGNRWKVLPVIEELKPLARAEGLWNMFVPPSHGGEPVHPFEFDGTPLTNLEYAPLAEEMGRLPWPPKCSIARRRTPATWNCWRATARMSSSRPGWSRWPMARSARPS